MVTLAHRCPSSVKVRPLTRCFTNRATDKGIRTVLVVRIITSVSSRRESWCERAISYWNFTNVSLPKHWADNWTSDIMVVIGVVMVRCMGQRNESTMGRPMAVVGWWYVRYNLENLDRTESKISDRIKIQLQRKYHYTVVW